MARSTRVYSRWTNPAPLTVTASRRWVGFRSAAPVVLLLVGCTLPVYHPGQPLDEPRLLATYRSRLRAARPESGRLTQRILVQACGHEFDLLGVLFLEPEGTCHALALGDMGVELFDLRVGPDQTEFVTKQPSIPSRLLSDGLAGDIRHLFGDKSRMSAQLISRAGAPPALVLRGRAGCLEEYQFTERQEMPVRSFTVRHNGIISEVEYRDPQTRLDLAEPLPGTIVVHNYAWRYSLQITLLDARNDDTAPHRTGSVGTP